MEHDDLVRRLRRNCRRWKWEDKHCGECAVCQSAATIERLERELAETVAARDAFRERADQQAPDQVELRVLLAEARAEQERLRRCLDESQQEAARDLIEARSHAEHQDRILEDIAQMVHAHAPDVPTLCARYVEARKDSELGRHISYSHLRRTKACPGDDRLMAWCEEDIDAAKEGD